MSISESSLSPKKELEAAREIIKNLQAGLEHAQSENDDYSTAFPIDEWHEDDGPALFWKFPIEDLPQVTSPLYSDFEEQCGLYGWTHFTKLKCPTIIVDCNTEG